MRQNVKHGVVWTHRFKTKLAASLARSRIKHDLLSIDCLLPESLRRNQERAGSLPLYAWVNPLKSRCVHEDKHYHAVTHTDA